MLPTFVIGLREGLEAALIVGIIAAFLSQQGRRDQLRWMWLGVLVALLLCGGAAWALHVAEENLPQREQEQLETIIALVAVGMITWMVVWMRRHSADLKGDLQERASLALVSGSALGTAILDACETAARAEGFTELALMATLPGVPLYRSWGFTDEQPQLVTMPDGAVLPGIVMSRTIGPAR